MAENLIPLESLIKQGQVETAITDGELHMTTTAELNTRFQLFDTPIKSFIQLPGTYQLPFTVHMTVKIDSPAFYLLIGKGHVGFATGIMDNRRITDILGGDYKPNSHMFNNDIPLNQYVELSVTYGRKAMWVRVDNTLRCFSKNDRYLKAKEIPEAFRNGFTIAAACDKRVMLVIQSIKVTEYGDGEPEAPADTSVPAPHSPCLSSAGKPTLAECIQGLTADIQKEIMQTDAYLLGELKKSMRFKRKIEGGYPCSKITYVSPWGLSYKIHISDTLTKHDIGWISYNTKREREKYDGIKKADYTLETLHKLAEESPDFADTIFFRMKECVGCSKAGAHCMHREYYALNERKKTACGGNIHFKMTAGDFSDLRKVVKAIDEVLQQGGRE